VIDLPVVFVPIFVRPAAFGLKGSYKDLTAVGARCDGCGNEILPTEQVFVINKNKYCSIHCFRLAHYALNGWGL